MIKPNGIGDNGSCLGATAADLVLSKQEGTADSSGGSSGDCGDSCWCNH